MFCQVKERMNKRENKKGNIYSYLINATSVPELRKEASLQKIKVILTT
jgi:hypothetical protein